MTEESSPIIDFYPTDFELDMNGKKQDWEAVVKIPFIDQDRLLRAMARESFGTLLITKLICSSRCPSHSRRKGAKQRQRIEHSICLRRDARLHLPLLPPRLFPGRFQVSLPLVTIRIADFGRRYRTHPRSLRWCPPWCQGSRRFPIPGHPSPHRFSRLPQCKCLPG